MVAGGNATDFGQWVGPSAIFRIDSLALLMGVVWPVGLALALFTQHRTNTLLWVQACLLLIGLLLAAYAREPLILSLGWEIAGLGGAAHLYTRQQGKSRAVVAALVHGPGLLLLVPTLLGRLSALAPPKGGVLQGWHLEIALLMGIAVCAATLIPTLIPTATSLNVQHPDWTLSLYATCAPFILAKMLVGGRWDAWGIWTLALLGTLGLLAVTWQSIRNASGTSMPVVALTMISIIGFGLASTSPTAALGSMLLLILAVLLASISQGLLRLSHSNALVLAGSAAGLWLIAQAALSARYGLISVLALPALLLVAAIESRKDQPAWHKATRPIVILVTILLFLTATYPQAAIEWLARPAVGAMAGGVAAPVDLARNWGVGLQVVSPAELTLASLPATGITLTVFLAWVFLNYIKRLATISEDRKQKTIRRFP